MSDQPVAALLQVKPGQSILVVNPPSGYRDRLRPLPNGARFVDAYSDNPDVVHVFVDSRNELDQAVADAVEKAPSDAILWVSYPKADSKHTGGMTRQAVHDSLRRHGAKPVSQFSFDDTWSAIRGRRA